MRGLRLVLALGAALLAIALRAAQPIAPVSVASAVLPTGSTRADAEAAWSSGRFTEVPASGQLPITGVGEELWTRVVWSNPDGGIRPVALEINDFFEDETSLYLPGATSGEWSEHRAGERVAFAERSLWGREPVLWFTTPPLPTFVTWINNGKDESQWPLFRIHDPGTDFLRSRRAHDVWLGFYYGGLLALGLYNLFLYGVLRRREILDFLVYVLTFGAGFFLYQGLHFEWLPWLQSPFHNLAIAVIIATSVTVLISFSRRFLSLDQYAPRTGRGLQWLSRVFAGIAVVVVGYGIVVFFAPDIWVRSTMPYLILFRSLSLLTAVAYAVISVAAATALRAGCREARFFLLGFGAIYLFTIPTLVMQARGAATGGDIVWVQIGSFVEMLFFAFALADKIRNMRDEKNAAEAKALAETAERTRLERANEEIMRQKEQLEELHRQKSEFLGIAAHDLKNPLNAVQGVAVILSDDESLPPSERMPESERREFLADIADSSRQMLGIIESLLETDSLESGRLRIELSSHPLGGLVDRAWRGLARTAEAKRITASLRVPTELSVLVDPDRFQRVLENLLSNAIKYSPPGGAILLQAVPSDVPGRVVIAVHDSGPGFTARDLAHLFGRYRKLSARPTAGETSSGLGLYIVHRLLELQGGTIAMVSPPGQSAIFRLEVRAG